MCGGYTSGTTTLLIAAVSGTLDVSSDELVAAAIQYLFLTVVFGALLGNMWEELAWTGFLQFFRLLLGIVCTRTGRSLLSVAPVHGSFNACSGSPLVDGGCGSTSPAAILVALIVIPLQLRRGRFTRAAA